MASIIRRAGSSFARRAQQAGGYVVRVGSSAGGIARRAGRGIARVGAAQGKTAAEIVTLEAAPSFMGGFAAELEVQGAYALGVRNPYALACTPLAPAVLTYGLGNMASGKVRRAAWNVANGHVAVAGQKIASVLGQRAAGR